MNHYATDPCLFVSTTDAASENQLARDLGYPETWHVVRRVPHPADREESSADIDERSGGAKGPEGSDDEEECDSKPAAKTAVSWLDTIYTGDPRNGVDVYYNHSAALGAMVKWDAEHSTGFDANGGQALPRKAKFSKGDIVEVLDEDSQTYHKANITKVRVYANDIRYTVFYPKENATQAVSEELLRLFVKPPPKKRKKSEDPKKMESLDKPKKKSAKKEAAVKETPGKKKRGRPKSSASNSPPSAKRGRRPMHASYEELVDSLSEEEYQDAIKMAKGLGLPEKWLAKRGTTYVYTIWSFPDFQKFSTKKAAYDHLGWDEKEIKSNIALNREEDETAEPLEGADLQEDEVTGDAMDAAVEEEEDDPPFRRSGHKYIGCRVLYKFTPEEAPDMDLSQAGTVTGWLDSTDVDSKGEPAFLSETSGQPAKLFHVDFDPIGQTLSPEDAALHLEFVDMEEWELEKVLISSEEIGEEKEASEETKTDMKNEDEADDGKGKNVSVD